LDFSTENDFSASIPFSVTQDSLFSSTLDGTTTLNNGKNKFLDTSEIMKRADAYENKAKFDLLNDDEEDEGDEVEAFKNTKQSDRSLNNKSSATLMESPFRSLNEQNLSSNNNKHSGNKHFFPTRYRSGDQEEDEEDENNEVEELDELNEDEYLPMGGGSNRKPARRNRKNSDPDNDVASVHSLALSDSQPFMEE
jgi:hypothetical protein